jgi:hypothetical protein
MSLIRAVVSVASIFLGLSAAVAQQAGTATNNAAASASSALTNPPVFQGLMVDAKGKTVGRVLDNGGYIARQISGVWVALQAFIDGFQPSSPDAVVYLFQSSDCTGPRYMGVTQLPGQGTVATVPPSTEPSVFFPGKPVLLNVASQGNYTTCDTFGGPRPAYVGPAQSVTVSSLGLTPPFSVK